VKQILKRFLKPVKWHNLRVVKPISNVFGFDRGLPIDRYYIEKFLSQNAQLIKGNVLEIGDNYYTKKFGGNISTSEILHYSNENKSATIIGDLTKKETLPENRIDCFICTQTFNFIYDFKKAIEGAHYLLKSNSVLLATLAGVCQISQYDMDRWGDYWRFTTASALKMFEEIFGEGNVEISSYGNVLSSVAFMHGLAAEELNKNELDAFDKNYQIIVTVVAKKKSGLHST
jgi:hypothetical protein